MDDVVGTAVARLVGREGVVLSFDTPLIGPSGLMDSMRLVELCLQLEDLATEEGFEFDWTSDTAMSRSRSMFRTIGTLAAEFRAQRDAAR